MFSFPLLRFQALKLLMGKSRYILTVEFLKKSRPGKHKWDSALTRQLHRGHEASHRGLKMGLGVIWYKCSGGSALGPLIWFDRTALPMSSRVCLRRKLLVPYGQVVRGMLTSMRLGNINWSISLWWEA